jgi:DNA-binding transcriptional regulator YdaS (Cro superfamily)
MNPREALERAIEIAGSQSALAAKIDVKQQTVSYWLRREDVRVPAEYCGPIEIATGISRGLLRPDLFQVAA